MKWILQRFVLAIQVNSFDSNIHRSREMIIDIVLIASRFLKLQAESLQGIYDFNDTLFTYIMQQENILLSVFSKLVPIYSFVITTISISVKMS